MDPQTEATIRLSAFFGILVVMALWELAAPRRPLRLGKGHRWLSNLGLVFVDTAFVRIVVPVTAVWLAQRAQASGSGLLNHLELAPGLEIFLAVMALDFIIYLQHVMFHMVPVLWRLHSVHHADGDIDVTTGLRFHPVEILISMGIKFFSIYSLGVAPTAVVIFEVLLNGTAMFNHSNVRLPLSVDKWLRLIVVTPDQHRIHHSTIVKETNSNFGFNMPWWDRLCGTYRAQPKLGHEGMEIGLEHYRDDKPSRLSWMLAHPFLPKPDTYSINAKS